MARRCPSRSGNFYTLRDLFAKGQKPSAIRFLLLSVPYRRQLNFTEDGLKQAQNSIERLRNFVSRLKTAQFPAGSNPDIVKRVEKAEQDFDAGLADDLNTAVALAAVFDLVRDINTAMDRDAFLQQDAPRVLAAMEKFDAILAVLVDDDAEKLRKLGLGAEQPRMSREQVEALDAGAQHRQAPPRFQALRRDPPGNWRILVFLWKIPRTAASGGSTNDSFLEHPGIRRTASPAKTAPVSSAWTDFFPLLLT